MLLFFLFVYFRLKKGKSSGSVHHHAAARHGAGSASNNVAAHREHSSPMSHSKKDHARQFWTEYFCDAVQAGGGFVSSVSDFFSRSTLASC
jgi:hypothetical protein